MRDSAARASLYVPEVFVEFLLAECNQPIHRRFEQQAARYPDAPALRLPSSDITYANLNVAANRAARRLLSAVSLGTGRGVSLDSVAPIALLLNQSYESVVWTLAILKAGHCYAPLDQRLPFPVLQSQIENLEPAAVVAGPVYLELARALAAGIFPVIDANLDQEFSSANLDRPVSPETTAYIFFTSGSTGAPKGVADSHRNVLHNVLRYTNTLKFSASDTLSLVQNPSFSGTASSLFGALLNGAALAPFDLQGEGLPALSSWLERARVTIFHAVPSIFRQLADPGTRFPHVRVVRLEGDRVSAADVEHFRVNFSNDCTLLNGLGATECGLVGQFFINKDTRLTGDEAVPIGYPAPDMTVRIIDQRGAILPAQSSGEIVVESAYLATGYWRNPALTAEKLLALDGGMRRYRTGDLGWLGADGCLVHLGRVDHRLRINGKFVDTAEIESGLLNIPGVKQCVVRDFEGQAGDRRLCAYVVADARVTFTQLRDALAERLLHGLVPAAFVFLDALPLTKDLKIDYQGLPRPGQQRPPLPNAYIAPQTALEQEFARIWSEVLELEQVGVTDSFFDLGGDSLQATRIVSRLSSKQRRIIQISTLFTCRTIRALTELLNGSE